MRIFFDMDGTISDLYANENWLERLRAYDPSPYRNAKPLINMSLLARYIHKVQAVGCIVGVISWLSKESTEEYNIAVTEAKYQWLKEHLPSVNFDEIYIVPYGTPKSQVPNQKGGLLFDDEARNRAEWGEGAYSPDEIFNILKELIR